MTTAVEIANQALGQARARTTISNLTQDTPEANTVNLNYTSVLERLLRRYDWNFARSVKQLALLKQATPNSAWTLAQPKLPWMYAYAQPSDCIKIKSVQNAGQGFGWNPHEVFYEYEIYLETINNNRQQAIGTNAVGAILTYTANITNPDLWDPDFSAAMVAELASELVIPLSGDVKLASALSKYAEDILKEAMVRDANSGSNSQDIVPDWIRARGDNCWL